MISLKNYFKDTTVKVKKFALALKGLIATVSGASFIQGDVKLAFYALVAGAAIAFLLDLLPPDQPGNNSSTGTVPPAAGAAAVLLFLVMLLPACTVVKPEVDRSKVDTTITSYKQVDIRVKGATVFKGLNLDSLYHAAMFAKQQRQSDSIAQLKYKVDSLAAVKANKPLPPKPVYIPSPPEVQYVTDPQTKALLGYWVDQYGKIQISCQAKDQTISTLQAQVTKLTKDTTTTTKVVMQTPGWNKILMIAEGVIIAVLVIVLIIKKLI